MALQYMTVKILNYYDLIYGGEAIIEACRLLDIPPYLQEKWISDYVSRNISLGV